MTPTSRLMRVQPSLCSCSPMRSAGFTLIEFMVAITVSLLVLVALSSIFVGNMCARAEVEKANQQIESGRYASQLLNDDLEMAGYLGEFDINRAALPTPATKPDPCAVTVAALQAALPLHIWGYDGGAVLSCISDHRANTDILVMRRVSGCITGSAGCAAVAGAPYFQASLCSDNAELLSTDSSNWYRLHTNTAILDRTRRDCAATADTRQFFVRIYYVSNNDQAGDGIPTLKRAELGASGFSVVPLVNGIEDMQLEFGIDTNNDGAPDSYTADPDSFGGCSGVACVDNWRNAMAVKLNLLARSTSPTIGYVDDKVYTLGQQADGTAQAAGPFSDNFKRHAFQSVVRLNNPAGRRQ